MVLIVTFNSFEDETPLYPPVPRTVFRLSIPLRMKREYDICPKKEELNSFNSFEDETVKDTLSRVTMLKNCFQFLWGWNKIPSPLSYEMATQFFQFLWGWNLGNL